MTHLQNIRFLRILASDPTLTVEEARLEACAPPCPADAPGPKRFPAGDDSDRGPAPSAGTHPTGAGRGD